MMARTKILLQMSLLDLAIALKLGKIITMIVMEISMTGVIVTLIMTMIIR